MRNENGFTLIEMSFVLSVAFILTTIIMSVGFKWAQGESERDAIDLLIADIYSLQSYAMAHSQHTKLSFQTIDGETYYISAAPQKEELAKRALPKGMRLSGTSSLKVVEFNPNGNITHSGVLTIVSETKRFALTFQFQRGRLIVNESERLLVARSDINRRGTTCYIRYIIA